MLLYDFLVCLQSCKNHKQPNILYSNKNLAEFCQLKQGAENSREHITQWVYCHSGCAVPTFMVHCGCSAVCICSYKHRTDAVMKSFQLIYLFWYYSEQLQAQLYSYQAVSEIEGMADIACLFLQSLLQFVVLFTAIYLTQSKVWALAFMFSEIKFRRSLINTLGAWITWVAYS